MLIILLFSFITDNLDGVTKGLTNLSAIQGSSDNISVIVVFLKDPHQISNSAWPSATIPTALENMDTAYDNSSNEVCVIASFNYY